MKRTVGSQMWILAGMLAALAVGFAGGWAAKPERRQTPPPAILVDAAESLEDIERRSGAVVEILNDMAAGRISRDPDALNSLRDSMQELTAAVGDVNSQFRQLIGR